MHLFEIDTTPINEQSRDFFCFSAKYMDHVITQNGATKMENATKAACVSEVMSTWKFNNFFGRACYSSKVENG